MLAELTIVKRCEIPDLNPYQVLFAGEVTRGAAFPATAERGIPPDWLCFIHFSGCARQGGCPSGRVKSTSGVRAE
ncbi:hypothetical protein, partial [Pseudacidovorax intermedius]|uniref:hypothetical protein n=1 Tax=Pseudacidovorax intermedius TaxID=433924 RepID=UPI001E58A581